MTRKILILAAALSGLSLFAGGSASAECQLQKIAELPVVMQGGRPTATVKINGQDVTMVIASGDFYSLISTEAAARLGMKSQQVYGLRLRGFGGNTQNAEAAKAKDFTFAGTTFHNTEFLVTNGAGGRIASGAIGQNMLGAADIEYDLAHGMVRFFDPKGCGGENLAYWAEGKPVSKLTLQNRSVALTDVATSAKIDGHNIRVKFSSGAAVSYLSRPAAARAGIRPTSEGVVPGGVVEGGFGKLLETSIGPFASFAIGDEEIKNTQLRMAEIDLGETDMLLGGDFFLSHRILVSKSQEKVYFTYNGGPVFRLNSGVKQAQADGAPAVTAEGAPTTAADFSRLGAALLARRDFAGAIADFTKAIDLEPNEGRHYYDRALARVDNRERTLAMADLDQALKLQPEDAQALLARGEMLAQAKDMARAQADFDAAMKAEPENKNMPLRIGAAYTRAGAYDQAIRLYDAWLTAHPKDDRIGQVLSARCNTRSSSGQQLEVALADCDAALKHGDKVSTAMENRGVVLLRMGRLDESIKQLDAAIHEQPKAAWALYMRGLAEQRKGLAAQADADIAAAVAIRPSIAQDAQRLGLAQQGAGPAKS